MKNKFLLLCLTALAVLAFSCSDDSDDVKKEEDDDQPPVGETRGMNIQDAQSLVLLGPAPNGRIGDVRPAYTPNLYKITEGGSMEVVKFLDAQGNVIDTKEAGTNVLVRWITPMNDEYVALTGDFVFPDSISTKHYTTLLLRKTDGAIFDFTQGGLVPPWKRLGEAVVKADGAGNLYYLTMDNAAGSVKKLDVSNPQQPAVSGYTSTGQEARYFEMDAHGNCLYKYGESGGVTQANGTADLRIRKANGGIFEVKVDGRDNREAWLGNNGSFYFITYTWDNGYLPAIHRITITGSEIAINTVWSANDDLDVNDAVGSMMRTESQGAYMIRKENSVVFVDTYFNRNLHWEFFEEDNTVRKFELPQVEEGALLVYSERYYYIASGTNLYKVDLDTHAYESLLPENAYEVYTMNVSADDVVQFSAMRFSDGKKIVAEISAAGALTVVSEELEAAAIVLQRLN
ncbi:hypothetical protein [Dawidia soli]|uniref:Lipoprotein n=1 Tax=Dawidia soli TaxID=2782352 RepID=A0AAP2DEA1_9BACT|nr:hypothetical protein [Dawidia soli]MBT1689561.1 hypothetical protein [Dawidia soli]